MRQLVLPLKAHGEEHPPGAGVEVEYRMTAKALTEEAGGIKVVYGNWRHLFGCWVVDPLTNHQREVLPTWPVLDRNGIWLPGQEVSYVSRNLNIPIHGQDRRDAADRAFAAYFSTLPPHYRRLAARFDNYQWLVLDLIWQVPEFAYLVDDAGIHDLLRRLASRLFCENVPRLRRAERLLIAREFVAGKTSRADQCSPPSNLLDHSGTEHLKSPVG